MSAGTGVRCCYIRWRETRCLARGLGGVGVGAMEFVRAWWKSRANMTVTAGLPVEFCREACEARRCAALEFLEVGGATAFLCHG